MDRFFNLPLKIWLNNIFPLLHPHDFINLITANKITYKYFTSGSLEISKKQDTWKLYFYKDIVEINHYMKCTYESMMSFFNFNVSAEEWEDIVIEILHRKLQIPITDMKQDQMSSLEKVKDFKDKISSSLLKKNLDWGNCQLLYDSFCVFLSFTDRAFYPIKYECDNVMLSCADAISRRDDFEFGNVAKTLGQLLEHFKILVSAYEQDNIYFKRRMRYTSEKQCLSFYRCMLNYCSPFESLGSLMNSNPSLFSIYLLTYIEKVLSLVYKNTFEKVSNILVCENNHGSYILKLNCRINNINYEMTIDKSAWSIKEIPFVDILPGDANFLFSCLLNKALFSSLIQAETGLGRQQVSQSPNMHFTEYANYPDLDFDRLKLYYHYTKYGYYTLGPGNNARLRILEGKITLVEKKKHKIKANGLLQKFWLLNSSNGNQCFLVSTEIGAINEITTLTKDVVKSDYTASGGKEKRRVEKTHETANAITSQGEKFSDTDDFMLYLIYGCGFVSNLHSFEICRDMFEVNGAPL